MGDTVAATPVALAAGLVALTVGTGGGGVAVASATTRSTR